MSQLRVAVREGLSQAYPDVPVVSRGSPSIHHDLAVNLIDDYGEWADARHASLRLVVVSAETATGIMRSILNGHNAVDRQAGPKKPE